jgi:hypothetical protein
MESKTDEIVEQRVVREVAGVVRTPEALGTWSMRPNSTDSIVRTSTSWRTSRPFANVSERCSCRWRISPMSRARRGEPSSIVTISRWRGLQRSLCCFRSARPSRLWVSWRPVEGLAAALTAAAAAGAASGGLGALAARHLGRDRAKLIETMIREGGLVVWVRVRTEEAERLAEQIMRGGGADAVRVHEIALDKRLSELPVAVVVADEIAGRA